MFQFKEVSMNGNSEENSDEDIKDINYCALNNLKRMDSYVVGQVDILLHIEYATNEMHFVPVLHGHLAFLPMRYSIE